MTFCDFFSEFFKENNRLTFTTHLYIIKILFLTQTSDVISYYLMKTYVGGTLTAFVIICDICLKKQINKKYNSHVTFIQASTMYMGLPASVVQLDVRPAGEQEVSGLTPPGRQLSFMEILS